MLNFLSSTSKLGATVLSIAAALFWFVYKGWFELAVFSQMTPEQTFLAFLISVSAAFALMVIAFLVHLSLKKKDGKQISAEGESMAFDNSGKNNKVNIRK